MHIRRHFVLALACGVCIALLQTGCTTAGTFLYRSDLRDSMRMASAGTVLYRTPGEETLENALGNRAASLEVLSAPPVEPDHTGRLLVYNGSLRIVVEKVADSLSHIKVIAESAGGYMKELTSQSITVCVLANRFNDVIMEVSKIGEVTAKISEDKKHAEIFQNSSLYLLWTLPTLWFPPWGTRLFMACWERQTTSVQVPHHFKRSCVPLEVLTEADTVECALAIARRP